jgi:flavin reductase (DIM6/NTAB) family NADH-FMN oxidoreductase RutF
MHVPVSAGDFRQAMRRLPTGVTIVAVVDEDGEPWGLTVSSFTSVSLDPPLVLVCIDRMSETHDRLLDAEGFGVSLLSVGQEPIARRFATDPSQGRFDGVDWHYGVVGEPIIDGSAAWFGCAVRDILPAGDHSIVVGEVVGTGVSGKASLVYHQGAFGSVAS